MDRQKMLTIFAAAWVSAALLTWFLYRSTKAPKQEKQVQVVAAARDLPVGTRVAKGDLKLVTLLEKEAPRTAVLKVDDAIGRAVVYPVNAGEPVTASRLTSATSAEGAAAIIEPGKRAASVPFTDASGAAGLIQPRSRVDVLFTRTGNAYEAMTVTVLEDVEVLSIGRTTQVDTQASGTATKGGAAAAVGNQNPNRTATVVVTPEQAQRLELAKNQGRISLVLRNPMDRSVRQEPKAATLEEIEPLLLARSGQTPRRGRLPGNLKDPTAWANLIGDDPSAAPKPPKPPEKKEPPKPRAVVDVFRGEKHVQEIFQ
ncbi:MAG: Flp pilus assembly protein CpaB [Bryobacteraceae bacterium]